jgi:hypothetical protein
MDNNKQEVTCSKKQIDNTGNKTCSKWIDENGNYVKDKSLSNARFDIILRYYKTKVINVLYYNLY